MDELIQAIEAFKDRFASVVAALHIPEENKRLADLKDQMVRPDFWKDRSSAERIAQEAANLEKWIAFWEQTGKRLHDLEDLARDDKRNKDVTLLGELTAELADIQRAVAGREVEAWLTEPYDRQPAILTIYSGAGGVDAQDWAEILVRMYIRFARMQQWQVSILQRTAGQGAGIKNATLRMAGPYAYGYLRAEAGVHRLVRLSQFDADHARHTSFAMVEVLPELEESSTITVEKDDVRVDVFRSSGHGGQSVNTTDSAVRLTHTPTGITVVCQNERSQLQNKEQAWKILLGKLERYYHAQREEERQLLRGELTENAWGSQIRSYVLHPYKMVKDHRTKHETHDAEAVLDGWIMPFIEAELQQEKRIAKRT